MLYLNINPSRHGTRISDLSPISLKGYRRSSPPPEPESAIWTTRTPLKSRIQTSPTAPLPLSARIPSIKSIPSYRASPMSTPQGSSLLSPITLFPSGDEEEDHAGPSHYNLRRDLPYSSGWQGEHDDDDYVVRDRDTVPDRPRPPAPYFLPPPLSQHARARWSFSWSFVFRGQRRRMMMGVPDWRAWRSWLSASTGHRRRRGLVWRFAGDCVGVALPAVVSWTVIGWLFF